MFGLFKTLPPLSTSQRVDLQWLMRRSRETFGDAFFKRDPVLIRADQIKIDSSSIDSRVQSIARELSPRFGMAPSQLKWEISNAEIFDEPVVYQLGENASAKVTVNASVVADDLPAIMTVANALARHAWQLNRQRDFDVLPQTTSLLPIMVGLGILASQASLQDKQWTTVGWSGWSLFRSGYYNTMEIGYAMALVNRVANPGDSLPPWLSALRLDSRSVCKQAIRHFKHVDAAKKPLLFDADHIPSQESAPDQIANWIAGEDTTFALAAAIVASRGEPLGEPIHAQVIDAALSATESPDVEIVAQSTELLGRSPANKSGDQRNVQAQLVKLSKHRSPAVAFSAIKSATKLGMPHSDFIATARRLLQAESFDLLPVLVWVEDGGKQCAALKPILMQHLDDAERFNHARATESLINCIRHVETG